MSQFNLMDLCRLCLDKDRVSIPIFEGEGVVKKLFMKIGACLPVKVAEDDRLPKKICDDCIYKVELVYSFWNTTANAEKQLLALLGDADSEPQVPSSTNSMKTDNNAIPKQDRLLQGSNSDIVRSLRRVETVLAEDGSSCTPCSDPSSTPGTATLSNHPAMAEASSMRSGDERSLDNREEDESGCEEESEEEVAYSDEEDDPAAVGDDVPSFSTLEPTFVSVDLMGDEAGPSGLQHEMEAETSGNEGEMSSMSHADESGKMEDCDPRTKPAVGRKPCEYCGKTFPINYLPQHRRVHTGERPYTCKVCSQTFPYEKSLRSHMVSHSDVRPYCCDVCQRCFKRNNELTMHRKIHLGEKSYVCSICGYSCIQKSNLVIHQRRHTNEYKFTCDICEKGCYTNQELQKHKMSHLDITHKCKVCGMEFNFKYGLTIHEKKHVPDYKPPVGKHQCELCGKTYVKKGGLKLHMRHHTGAKPHTCNVCGKSVSSRGTLEVHYRIHSGEKPNICEVCGKAFSSRRYLVTHMRSHTGEKPFSCKQCGKSFTQQSTLIVHQRYHTGCRPHECSVCHKGFVLKAQLRSHQKSLNHYPPPIQGEPEPMIQVNLPEYVDVDVDAPMDQTPVACQVCSQVFLSKAHLMVHQKETYHYMPGEAIG